jgi:transcriptional regulator of aromatic amino acid metabolism
MALFPQSFASEPILVGNSPRLRHVQRMVDKLATGRWPALILGETGTGKEVVARAIHAFDPRPGAWGVVRDTETRLFGARAVTDRRGEPGEVLEVGEMGMFIACGTGAVAVESVHPAGRRRVAALDWAQGRGVSVGDCFTPIGA